MNKGKRLDAVLLALGWREEGSLLPLRYKEPDLVRYTVPGRSNGTDSWSVPRHSLVPLMKFPLEALPLMIAKGPPVGRSVEGFRDVDVPFFSKRMELGL